jgi:membrane-associated phospholipid phosphatase
MWAGAFLLSATLVLQSPQAAAPAPAENPWPDSRPITHILQNLVRDLGHLPSTTSLKTLLVGSAAAALVGTSDRSTADWAGRAGTSRYTKSGDLIGAAAVQGGGALVTYGIGKLTHRPAITHVGGDLIRAQVVTALMTHGLKFSVGRTRPNGGSHSFPSGHTSATFASAAVLSGHFGWKVAVPSYATASLVAWTRIRDRKHYPSDVVFGATLGLIAGQTITHGHRSWTVVPVRTTGGFALYLTRSR